MRLLEELAGSGKLLSPDVAQPARIRDGRIVSASGRDLGSVDGPLNLLKDQATPSASAHVKAKDVERIRVQLELPATAHVDGQIAQAIGATASRLGVAHLSAEVRLLAERFGLQALDLEASPAPLASPIRRMMTSLRDAFAGSSPRAVRGLERISDSVGSKLAANETVYRSIRVRNVGAAVVSAGPGAGCIETRWTTPSGEEIATLAERTDLPIDLESGREITLIVRLRTPGDPGRYRLDARLSAPATERDGRFFSAEVEVVPGALPVFPHTHLPQNQEYASDHHLAMVEAAEFIAQRFGDRSLSLLEIGGGVHPTAHSLALRGHRVVSSDISHAQSILGTLYFRHKMPALDESLAFVTCDGTDLPFADGAFDGVVLFAAFHHFAEPVALLREIRRVTRPEGFAFLGCDPCVPDPTNAEYRAELRRGINEQMWTLAEFAAFFRDAGFDVARARIDGQSLKVALTSTASAGTIS
jgi:ubiquinone/menaquinone biosynthesis C-methylase UbiE